jgi:hypothetical protein
MQRDSFEARKLIGVDWRCLQAHVAFQYNGMKPPDKDNVKPFNTIRLAISTW